MQRETSEDGAVISAGGLVKSYGGFRLGPVDLTVRPGYVVAVVGPNGSGKSTLFRMLIGLSAPDSGDLALFGLRHPRDEVGIKRRIGYVPEASTGHDDLSANGLGEFVSHWYPDWDERLYAGLLERLQIPATRRFGRLSKGMQRRLVFAVALARRPELLLLDEPTDGVDPFARRAMLEEVSRYLDGGDTPGARTVVLATHVMDEVRRVADYVAFLHGGRFLGLYEKDALVDSWRSLWVERAPDGYLPGLVAVESGTPTRLVTDSPEKTREALAGKGIGVVRSGPLDLEEILEHLMLQTRGKES